MGIEIEEIELNAINKKLTLRNKCDILEELNKLTSNPRKWLWILNDLRNQSMHRGLINVKVSQNLHEDVNTNANTGDRPKVFLVTYCQSNLEVIPYFEDSIQKMTDLIERIKNKLPELN